MPRTPDHQAAGRVRSVAANSQFLHQPASSFCVSGCLRMYVAT